METLDCTREMLGSTKDLLENNLVMWESKKVK